MVATIEVTVQAYGSLESWAGQEGAALTFTDRTNELEVRAFDGVKARDGLVDHLLDQIEQHHRRRLSAQIQHIVLVPEQGWGVGHHRSTFAPSIGYEDGASRGSYGLWRTFSERSCANQLGQTTFWPTPQQLGEALAFLIVWDASVGETVCAAAGCGPCAVLCLWVSG